MFVSKFNPSGSSLIYSTYLGGSQNDTASFGVFAQVYDANGHLTTTTLKKYTGDPANPSPAKDLVL